MPTAALRANARTMPGDTRLLRARLAAAAERIIAALDALDAPEEDREDGFDAEEEIGEPSLGSTGDMHQDVAWATTCSDADLEHDDAELSGIADEGGYGEQLAGEPSLGATLDLDQRVAWGPDRLASAYVVDGEATGTVDDIAVDGLDEKLWSAQRALLDQTRRELAAIVQRQRAPAEQGAAR
jgi:hypothetical protein